MKWKPECAAPLEQTAAPWEEEVIQQEGAEVVVQVHSPQHEYSLH